MSRRDSVAFTMTCLLVLGSPGQVGAQHHQDEIQPIEPFEVDYFEASQTIELTGDADRVFQLFTPEGRQQWSSFDPIMLYEPAHGWQGAVYLQATIHDDPNTSFVADYEPENRRIRYLTVIPYSEAWEMDITVTGDQNAAQATVTYRVTPLSPEANEYVRSFFEEDFEPAIQRWEAAINTVLSEHESPH